MSGGRYRLPVWKQSACDICPLTATVDEVEALG